MAKFFQHLTPNESIRYGKELKTGASGIYPGLLVQLDSTGSTVTTSGSTTATKPLGIAFGSRYQPYRPTSQTFASGEPLTVIMGTGQVLLSTDFFSEGALPSVNDKLYSYTGGKWTKSPNSVQVGDCIGVKVWTVPVGGVGTTQNVALCRFNIQP